MWIMASLFPGNTPPHSFVHSGQVAQAQVADSVLVRYDPDSNRMNSAPVAASASGGKSRAFPAAHEGASILIPPRYAMISTSTQQAIVSSATARCVSTTWPASSVVTVTAPSRACTITRTSAAVTGHMTHGSLR